MKIIFLRSNNPFSTDSAAANRYLTLMEGLSKLGVKVTLIITGGFLSKNERKAFGKNGSINGVTYKYFSTIVISGYLFKRIYKYIFQPVLQSIRAKKIRKWLNFQENGTVIWPSVSMEALIALRNKIQGKIYFCENNEYPDIQNHNKGNFLQRWTAGNAEKYFEEKIFPQLDGMALMTRTLMKYYSAFPAPAPKLLHLPMTVDLERFKPRSKYPLKKGLEQPYIAFVGVMNDKKEGVNFLINAFAQITPDFPDIKLYLFGFWHYDSPGHSEQIERLGLENKINYQGSISRDEVSSVIMNACLLVLPRPDSHQAQGGFPTKLGEYLASANPVCATRVGEIPDYLTDEESVFFAEPGSAESFADAMRRALNNPEKARQVGLNGRKVAETHFNKDKQAKVLYDFLNTLPRTT